MDAVRALVIGAFVPNFPAMPIHEEASVEFHLPAMDALGRLDIDGKVRFADGVLYVHWKRRDRTFTRTQNKLATAEIGLDAAAKALDWRTHYKSVG